MRRLILAAALPLALVACKAEKPADPPPRPVVSEVVSPKSGLQQGYVGSIAARIETDLGFPLAGTMAERPVREGDVVTKGETLALLDPQDLDAAVRAAEAGVTVAGAQLNSALDAATRASELVQRGVDSPAAAESAASTLAAAKAGLEQARASLTKARDLRSFATLSAPQDGVVTQVYVQPGASLTAGQSVLRLAGTHQREAIIDLTDQDVAGLSPGAVFHIRLEAAPEIETRGTLRVIDPVSDRATRTRRLHLTLAADAAPSFRLGALVTVEPDAETVARTTLPVTALIGGQPAVWVVDRSSNTVHRTTISTGAVTGERVLVLAGLKPGDEVVSKGVNSIKDGQSVGPSVSQ